MGDVLAGFWLDREGLLVVCCRMCSGVLEE